MCAYVKHVFRETMATFKKRKDKTLSEVGRFEYRFGEAEI